MVFRLNITLYSNKLILIIVQGSTQLKSKQLRLDCIISLQIFMQSVFYQWRIGPPGNLDFPGRPPSVFMYEPFYDSHQNIYFNMNLIFKCVIKWTISVRDCIHFYWIITYLRFDVWINEKQAANFLKGPLVIRHLKHLSGKKKMPIIHHSCSAVAEQQSFKKVKLK